jgi:hypothetical protein
MQTRLDVQIRTHGFFDSDTDGLPAWVQETRSRDLAIPMLNEIDEIYEKHKLVVESKHGKLAIHTMKVLCLVHELSIVNQTYKLHKDSRGKGSLFLKVLRLPELIAFANHMIMHGELI